MRTVKGASGWLWVVAIIGFVGGSGNQRSAAREPSREPTVLDRISGYTSGADLTGAYPPGVPLGHDDRDLGCIGH